MGIYDREYYRGEGVSGWFGGTAPVCRTLIAINIAVFLALKFAPGSGLQSFLSASSSDIFTKGHIWQLLTATFVHEQLFPHLLINMLLLWFFGREMESMYGSRDFLGLYLTAGVFSTLCWAAIDYLGPSLGGGVMQGASGAVTAVFVLYALYFPRREVLLMFVLPVPIWLLVVVYLGFDLLFLLQQMQGAQTASVAFASHLGGAAFGYLFKAYNLRTSRFSGWLPPWNRRRFKVVPRPTRSNSGSTWLEGPVPTPAPARATAKPAEPSGEGLEERVDEILAKIATQGQSSLTDDEKGILQEASQRARLRRSHRI